MLVACWVLLGLEERVKVPEGALNEVVGWHLSEPDGRHGLAALPVPGSWATNPWPCAHPISRKICRNWVRTLSRGCRWPLSGRTPWAEKL